jgi:hypothetical protein
MVFRLGFLPANLTEAAETDVALVPAGGGAESLELPVGVVGLGKGLETCFALWLRRESIFLTTRSEGISLLVSSLVIAATWNFPLPEDGLRFDCGHSNQSPARPSNKIRHACRSIDRYASHKLPPISQ